MVVVLLVLLLRVLVVAPMKEGVAFTSEEEEPGLGGTSHHAVGGRPRPKCWQEEKARVRPREAALL